MQLLSSVCITAHLKETTEHNSISPNRDFRGNLDLQDEPRNVWTDIRAKKSPDASDNAQSVKQLNTMKYMTAFHSKPDTIQQESIFGLEPLSEQSKAGGAVKGGVTETQGQPGIWDSRLSTITGYSVYASHEL